MGAGSTVEINPQTGLLTVEPTNLGVFSVGICATTYLNGQQWTSIKRDFQFKVFDCVADAATDPQVVNGAPLNPINVPGIGQIDATWLVCSEFTVQFAQNSNNAINHFWDFGVEGVDSDTSVAPLPSFTFPDTGTYIITYVVNRNEPCVDTAYGLVKIFPRLVPGFAADVNCFKLPVQFTDTTLSTLLENQVINWVWDFGDGSLGSTVQNPSYEYANPGTYLVSMSIETALGCIDTYELTVEPEPGPVAIFDNLFNCTGEAHTFVNLSELNGVELESYSWDFGDGNDFSLTTTDVNPPPVLYPDSGVYNVSLIVTSTNGCADTTSADIVVAARVHADYSYLPASICPGQAVSFTNLTPEYFDSLQWNIDGNIFTIDNPTLTFTTSGVKPISLILYSNEICGDSIVETITVEAGPLADFEIDSTCVGLPFNFINNSSENGITIDSFLWNFGDGTTAVGFSPTHTYGVAGDYTVELVALTSLACKDTTTRVIPVKEELAALFLYTPDTICEGVTPVTFEDLSTGGPWDNILWEFGDDSTSTDAMPVHLYLEGGLYPVVLTLFDDVCPDVNVTETVEVLDIPFLDLPDTLNICDGIIKTLSVGNPGSYIVYWSTGDSLVNSIQIDNSIDSARVYVDNGGCRNSDLTIVTRDCPAYLPNTFTPNGDGVNDFFIPFRNNVTSFTLRIFNRWGEEVFSTSDFERPWDGRFQGQNAPMETYVYTLKGIGLDERPLMQFGTVSILR
jgi:gliding motility-associated-like protein